MGGTASGLPHCTTLTDNTATVFLKHNVSTVSWSCFCQFPLNQAVCEPALGESSFICRALPSLLILATFCSLQVNYKITVNCTENVFSCVRDLNDQIEQDVVLHFPLICVLQKAKSSFILWTSTESTNRNATAISQLCTTMNEKSTSVTGWGNLAKASFWYLPGLIF